jgi:hypothetical protein
MSPPCNGKNCDDSGQCEKARLNRLKRWQSDDAIIDGDSGRREQRGREKAIEKKL